MKKVEAFFVVLLWVGIVLFLFGGSRAAACGGVVEGLMILITLVYTHISILNVHSKLLICRFNLILTCLLASISED